MRMKLRRLDSKKIIKVSCISVLAVSAILPNLGLAKNFYFRSGPSVNSLMVHNPYGKNPQEIFSAVDMVGGVDYEKYSYELGYTTSIPKDIGFDYFSRQKVKLTFSNIYFDLNRNLHYSNDLKFYAGIGAGLLNIKAFASKYDFNTMSRDESSNFTQLLQARANIGTRYNITEKLKTNIDLSGQGGSLSKPMVFGAGINLNYLF